MALLPGYEYDIFISYRHNDNLDGWVSGFVEALEKELKATIKEPLSIYFDKNPHDGLLETHHVDKSLEGKLKCLIFIPIISQTYCDTKSFAWQHEFVAFNKLAKEDELGREIKLSNSNVASRILPVKIHDLDASDKAIFENELGGALRAIEFIYKEPGVNRPLKPTDSKADNQNKTDYRNQINKVANAVKELVTAWRSSPNSRPVMRESKPLTATPASPKKLLIVTTVMIAAVVAGYFLFSRFSVSEQQLDKSIAVLPFTDMSPNHEYEFLGDGISEEIINALSGYTDLRVIARTSSFQFKNVNQDVRLIAEKLNATHILEGSIRMFERTARVNATLVDGGSGEQIWSKSITLQRANLLELQEVIASDVASAIQVKTKRKNTAYSSKNPLAYEFYLRGLFFHNRGSPDDLSKARMYFEKSLKQDSSQATVWSYMYALAENRSESEFFAQKAYQADSTSEAALVVHCFELLSQLRFRDSDRYLGRILDLNSKNPKTLRNAAMFACRLGYYKLGIQLAEQAAALDPAQTWSFFQLGEAYAAAGELDKAISAYRQSIELAQESPLVKSKLIDVLALSGQLDTIRAMKLEIELEEYSKLILKLSAKDQRPCGKLDWNTDEVFFELAECYAFAGNSEQALKHLQRAVERRDEDVQMILSTPFFLHLRQHEEFQDMIRKLEYPAQSRESS